MGNYSDKKSKAQSQYGNIFVRTDKPFYYQGYPISGSPIKKYIRNYLYKY